MSIGRPSASVISCERSARTRGANGAMDSSKGSMGQGLKGCGADWNSRKCNEQKEDGREVPALERGSGACCCVEAGHGLCGKGGAGCGHGLCMGAVAGDAEAVR